MDNRSSPEHDAELLSRQFVREDSDKTPSLSVAALIEAVPEPEFRVLAGARGLERLLTYPKVQLLGLALGGFTDDLYPGSIQIVGKAELRFIHERIGEDPDRFLDPTLGSEIGCLVVPEIPEDTETSFLPQTLIGKAEEAGVPVLVSALSRQRVEAFLGRRLEERLAPSICLHGGLVVFCGLGLLILGKSGIGKSDCALDLIMHGHQLVADDGVSIRRNPLGQLIGRSRELIREHMDIRGLGIVNIRELFSVYSVIEEHPIDLVILLEPWEEGNPYACFNETGSLEILDVIKPQIRLPVSPGRNWSNLIHVAVRRFILATKGYDAETALARKLDAMLSRETSPGRTAGVEQVRPDSS